MDTTNGPSPLPQTAKIPGLDNIIVPPKNTLYQAWQMIPEMPPDQAPPLYPAPMGEEHIEKPDYPSLTLLKPQQGNARPWWARLLVDSMLVPFVQGFMLNLGIHWVRYWRRGGGLVGVFRGRFGPRKSAP